MEKSDSAKLLLVNFHHIREPAKSFPKLHHRTPEQFQAQIEVLSRGYQFISPEQLEEAVFDSQAWPERDSVFFTFDDGLKDHWETVAPILAKNGIRAAFFLNTAPWETGEPLSVHMAHLLSGRWSYLELEADFVAAAEELGFQGGLEQAPEDRAIQQYRYDEPRVARIKFLINAVVPQSDRSSLIRKVFVKRLGNPEEFTAIHYLTPEMARGLHEHGHRLGLHTHSHLQMAVSSADEIRQDLVKNRTLLAGAIGVSESRLDWISYPYGSPQAINSSVIELSRTLNCRLGVTMFRGANRPGVDPMALQRVDTNDAPGGKSPMTGL